MAEIRRYPMVRHLRAERTSYVLKYRRGRKHRTGPGLALWFWPLTTSIAEVPVDDREVPFVFHARSADFQDVTVQGVINYRISDPELIAERVDFAIDLGSGLHVKQPLDTIASMLTELSQQLAFRYLARTGVREILAVGRDHIRHEIVEGLAAEPAVAELGLRIVSVRVSSVKPSPEVERALETRTREQIQQEADEATFARRALAVEKERAIAENELQNQIELAIRTQRLIDQEGANERRRAEELAAAKRIEVEARAEGTKIRSGAEAEGIRLVETARLESERERMDIYAQLRPAVMLGLAARELAGKLERIEHLNLSPDLLGPSLLTLLDGANKKLAE